MVNERWEVYSFGTALGCYIGRGVRGEVRIGRLPEAVISMGGTGMTTQSITPRLGSIVVFFHVFGCLNNTRHILLLLNKSPSGRISSN